MYSMLILCSVGIFTVLEDNYVKLFLVLRVCRLGLYFAVVRDRQEYMVGEEAGAIGN